jgi:hypothetical protein
VRLCGLPLRKERPAKLPGGLVDSVRLGHAVWWPARRRARPTLRRRRHCSPRKRSPLQCANRLNQAATPQHRAMACPSGALAARHQRCPLRGTFCAAFCVSLANPARSRAPLPAVCQAVPLRANRCGEADRRVRCSRQRSALSAHCVVGSSSHRRYRAAIS